MADCPHTEKVRWDSIDFIKGVACIAVVFIHVRFPLPFTHPVAAACRFGVPLFLVVSGFFFTSHGACSLASTARKLRHALMLGIVSTAALVVLALVQCWLAPCSSALGFIRSHATVKDAASFFITNAPTPPLVHLWFLWALVYCYVFALLWFADGRRLWTAGSLGLILLVGMVLFQEFTRFLPFAPKIPLRGLPVSLCHTFAFRALPFFLLGIWLRRHENAVRRCALPNWSFAAFALTGGFMSVVEWRLFGVSQFYIGSYITVAAMFAWAIRNPGGGVGPVTYIGRNLSLLVYVLHISVLNFLMLALRCLHVDQMLLVRWTLPIMVVILTLLVAFVLDAAWRRITRG